MSYITPYSVRMSSMAALVYLLSLWSLSGHTTPSQPAMRTSAPVRETGFHHKFEHAEERAQHTTTEPLGGTSSAPQTNTTQASMGGVVVLALAVMLAVAIIRKVARWRKARSESKHSSPTRFGGKRPSRPSGAQAAAPGVVFRKPPKAEQQQFQMKEPQ
jgi:hypothetical protein